MIHILNNHQHTLFQRFYAGLVQILKLTSWGLSYSTQNRSHRYDIDCQAADIQVVSIHIPKTAGTSFGNILKSVYGKKLMRVDINRIQSPPRTVPRYIQVLHGHFRYPDINHIFNLSPDAAIITWVRNPVERVISNYFYLKKHFHKMIAEERKKVNVLNKMEKNILEFAELKRNRNRMARFLRGLSLNDFFFVGIQDFLEEDLKDLAQMLGWNICLAFHNNRNELKGAAITDKMRQKIEELNRSDIEIYKEALRIREFRRKKIGHPI